MLSRPAGWAGSSEQQARKDISSSSERSEVCSPALCARSPRLTRRSLETFGRTSRGGRPPGALPARQATSRSSRIVRTCCAVESLGGERLQPRLFKTPLITAHVTESIVPSYCPFSSVTAWFGLPWPWLGRPHPPARSQAVPSPPPHPPREERAAPPVGPGGQRALSLSLSSPNPLARTGLHPKPLGG